MLDGGARPARVVGQHAVGFDADRRTVEEHDRRRLQHLALDPVVVALAAGRHQQQCVDAPAQQGPDQLALALRVLLARAGDQQVAALAGGAFDGLGDGRVERVRDILDHETERRRREP